MNLYTTRPPVIFRKLYASASWRIKTTDPVIYLTFDDGPHPEITSWVLEELSKFSAKATFFCVGENILKYPDTFNSILTGGHSIGNHSMHHMNGWKTNDEKYLNDIAECQTTIDNNSSLVNRHSSFLLRPPYGRMKPAQYTHLRDKYTIIMWDVLSGDFDPALSQEKCLNNSIAKSRPGSIVVFHDSEKAFDKLKWVLPKYLDEMSKAGYSFNCLQP